MEYLIELRELLGISQAYFAHLLGVTRSQLNNAELGTRKLPIKARVLARKLETALLDKGFQMASVGKTHRIPKNLANELDVLDEWFYAKGKFYKELAQLLTVRHEHASRCLAVLPGVFDGVAESMPEDYAGGSALNVILGTSRQQMKLYPLELAKRCAKMGEQLLAIGGKKG